MTDRNPACFAGDDDFDRLTFFPAELSRRRRSRHRRQVFERGPISAILPPPNSAAETSRLV